MRAGLTWVLLLCLVDGCARAASPLGCPPMPEALTKVAHDVKSDIDGSVGSLGKLKAGEVGFHTEVVASTLFGKYPNVDRLIELQIMASTYCTMLAQSDLPKAEIVARWERFQDKVLDLKTETQTQAKTPTSAQVRLADATRPLIPEPAKIASQPQPTPSSPSPSSKPIAIPSSSPAPSSGLAAALSSASSPASSSASSSVPSSTADPGTPRFVTEACGAIHDTRTGLRWMVGPDRDTPWDGAKGWADGLDACSAGWRLPTVAELRGLFMADSTAGTGYFVAGRHWPAHLAPAFAAIGGGSWVWSDQASDDDRAVSYNFNQGVAVTYEKSARAFPTRAFAVAH